MAVVPVLVMVMLSVSPLFQALTELVTRQALLPPGGLEVGVPWWGWWCPRRR